MTRPTPDPGRCRTAERGGGPRPSIPSPVLGQFEHQVLLAILRRGSESYSVVFSGLVEAYPDANRRWFTRAEPLADYRVGRSRSFLVLLAVGLGISLAVGLAVGLVPLGRIRPDRLQAHLKDGTRGSSARRGVLGGVLVATEVALAA